MSAVPNDRRLAVLLATSNGPLERCYTRFLDRTAADWLLLCSFLLLAQAKVPAILDRFYRYEPIILVIYVVPFLVAALGVLRSRTEFSMVLRGTATWTITLGSAFACGVIGFLSLRAAQFIIASASGAVRAPFLDDAFDYIFLWPIVEELIFQVALQTRLMRFGTVASVLLTTAIFTLFHLVDIGHFPSRNEVLGIAPLFPVLLLLAIFRQWNGSLVGLVVAHSMVNLLALSVG